MKDLPHHMKKLNRSVIRSVHREEQQLQGLPSAPNWPDSSLEKKKKAKQEMRRKSQARPFKMKSPEERNQEMKKGRVPIFDRNKAQPKHAKASKKKTPRI